MSSENRSDPGKNSSNLIIRNVQVNIDGLFLVALALSFAIIASAWLVYRRITKE